MISTKRTAELLSAFRGLKVGVLGDMVADRYVFTEPIRLSREAPVIVVRHVEERTILGGAANAVNNLKAFGATVVPFGVAGNDDAGRMLEEGFAAAGISAEGLVRSASYRTVAKTRILAGDPNRTKQQLLRVDREPNGPPERAALDELRRRLIAAAPKLDALILSDYGYGTTPDDVVAAARDAFKGRVVAADSRFRIPDFRGVAVATPNEDEASAAFGRPIRDTEALEAAGRDLLRRLESRALLITRGNRGMALFEPGAPRLDVPAVGSGEVTDVSGAGDTVIATLTLALAAGASYPEATRLSNAAAGVVVMKVGAATCSPEELLSAVEGAGS
jgi:D-glycero-beta-D-manno-heptose-7-phosphate kinase